MFLKNNSNFKFLKPYIIAEIGSNFNQSIDLAFKLISSAKNAGADAVKFQLFNAKKMYPNDKKMFSLFKSIELNKNWIPKLKKFSESIGVDFLVSPFDIDSAKTLKKNNLTGYKVASSELTNLKMINYLSSIRKPLFVSTGMSDLIDIKNAIKIFKKNKNNKIVLMQCGSMYPLPEKYANLSVLNTFKKFNLQLGFSDHTKGTFSATVAIGLGAMIFEKHFTLSKKSKGPDHFFAMEPSQFTRYVKNIHRAYLNLGDDEKLMLPDEKKFSRREGAYYKRELLKGHKIRATDIIKKRPSLGIRARDVKIVINKKLKSTVKANSPIFFKDVLK
jgi:sialic acid synthase SpsE|tara:strand:+ start:1493 stop:2485 length:993 start_codon:yes stop_codon:yes gene_type:complete